MKIGSVILISMLLSTQWLWAQFQLDGQILQRAEFRNGYAKPIESGLEPAAFIAHRIRLQVGYEMEKFKFYASIQDVRTWGNTSQVKATDPYLSLHEGWAETTLAKNWSIKLGRQELNYDNFRFLGNLDWALQGRAHDFALVKYEREKVKLHLGGGFNQQEQRLTSTTYTQENQYKTAQFVRYENQWNNTWHLSLLFWNDGRENTGKHYYTQTFGLPTLKFQKGNTTVSGYYYQQVGKTSQDLSRNAFNTSIQIKQVIDFTAPPSEESEMKQSQKLQLVAGFELLSGTSSTITTENNSFSPLYGTNHIFNGYLDWFFVGGGFENSVGLQDYYAKARYDFNTKLFLQTDVHVFQSMAKAYDSNNEELSKNLGTELDVSLGFIVNKAVSIQGGYSQMWATDTLVGLKGAINPSEVQNWAYVMFIIRPTMKNKFVGIML